MPMYDGRITVKDFLDALDEEADVSIAIPRANPLRWLSAVEQFAYTEILREYRRAEIDLTIVPTDVIRLDLLPVPSGAAAPVYDDIIRVYGEEGQEIRKAGAVAGYEFPDFDMYYADYNGNMVLHTRIEQEKATIIYRIRPEIKTEDNEESLNVALPVEYLDMAAAKIRGEAYKVANEDGLAAKWLADYNTQVENFKVWAASRNERYGL